MLAGVCRKEPLLRRFGLTQNKSSFVLHNGKKSNRPPLAMHEVITVSLMSQMLTHNACISTVTCRVDICLKCQTLHQKAA